VLILTATSNPQSMCREMGLTQLEGGDRLSYKHSSHFIVGFTPLGVRAPLQGFSPSQSLDNAAP